MAKLFRESTIRMTARLSAGFLCEHIKQAFSSMEELLQQMQHALVDEHAKAANFDHEPKKAELWRGWRLFRGKPQRTNDMSRPEYVR